MAGMRSRRTPHKRLQTVTWLIAGNVFSLHATSLA